MDDNLDDVILAVNSIELAQEDLLELVLKATRIFISFHKDKAQFIDSLFDSGNFLQACLETARESLLLGIQTLIMKDGFDFEGLTRGCFNISSRESLIENLSMNEETKEFLREFFSFLAIEIFTGAISRNKVLNDISNITPQIVSNRSHFFKRYANFKL